MALDALNMKGLILGISNMLCNVSDVVISYIVGLSV